jgi:hypothetical protein
MHTFISLLVTLPPIMLAMLAGLALALVASPVVGFMLWTRRQQTRAAQPVRA